MFSMLLAVIMSFLISVLLMPIFIRYMKRQQFGQVSREEGPKWHAFKDGTPTMGGTIILIAVCLSVLIAFGANGHFTASGLLVLLSLFFFGMIGFLDDFIKIFRRQNEGLKSHQKFILQLIGSLLFVLLFKISGLQFMMSLPFFGIISSIWFFVPFAMFWLTGFSNAVNLTDGLDGLCAGTSIIAYAIYAYFSYQKGYLDLALVCLSVVSSLIGFYLYNRKPAKIFMGDVGSLALGAGLATMSIILQMQWALILVGIVFVMETLSVIIQVTSFKLTGKRVFKMSPIHHHFELLGWRETVVVRRFWLVGLIAGILAIIIF